MANDFNPDESADFGAAASTAATLPTSGAAPLGTVPLSAQWTKIGIINEALINTANNTVSLPGDLNTDEWRVASPIYDQWLAITVYRRTWKFATRIIGLDRVGDSPFPGYADVFAKPVDCLYLENCWRGDLAALIQPALFGTPSEQYDTMAPPLDYAVIGDQVHTTAQQQDLTPGPAGDFSTDLGTDFSGDPRGPIGLAGDFNDDFSNDFSNAALIYCQYIPFPTQGQPFSVGFIAALRLKVEAGLFRGLNEDFSEANRADKQAEEALMEAAARNDSEEPRKVAFRSRLIERRRVPRYGWGGC